MDHPHGTLLACDVTTAACRLLPDELGAHLGLALYQKLAMLEYAEERFRGRVRLVREPGGQHTVLVGEAASSAPLAVSEDRLAESVVRGEIAPLFDDHLEQCLSGQIVC